MDMYILFHFIKRVKNMTLIYKITFMFFKTRKVTFFLQKKTPQIFILISHQNFFLFTK